MATPTGPSAGEADIREGFLCPICMCDLGTLAQLSVHFDNAHSGEDRDALQQLKDLFGKAKKKIKQRTGGDDSENDPTTSEGDSSLTTEAPPWEEEPQLLGLTRSHTSAFKDFRDERNSHAAIQRNKLVIRLKKLVDPCSPTDPQRRKEFEKSLVRWAPDEDVPLCPFCAATMGPPGGLANTIKNLTKSTDVGDTPVVKLKELKEKFKFKQLVGSRRHHCRTCGAVMCHDCSFFLSFSMADCVCDVIDEGNEVRDSIPEEAKKTPAKGIRKSESNSSLNSMAAFEGELYVRICRDCWTILESRFRYLETLHKPHPIAPLYRLLMRNLHEIEKECPIYVDMARSLHRGEQTHDLTEAQRKRLTLMKLYEGVDQVSKKILASGKQSEAANGLSPRQEKLQRVIRQMAANFLQEYVFGLQSLPTEEQYEKLKEERQKELMRQIEAQRQAELEAKRLTEKLDQADDDALMKRPTDLSVGTSGPSKDGWLPTQVASQAAEDDPLLQQIGIIKGYIDQAKQAGKNDEVKMLTENLKELQLVVRRQRQEERRIEEERKVEERERTRLEEERNKEPTNNSGTLDYPDQLNPFAEEE